MGNHFEEMCASTAEMESELPAPCTLHWTDFRFRDLTFEAPENGKWFRTFRTVGLQELMRLDIQRLVYSVFLDAGWGIASLIRLAFPGTLDSAADEPSAGARVAACRCWVTKATSGARASCQSQRCERHPRQPRNPGPASWKPQRPSSYADRICEVYDQYTMYSLQGSVVVLIGHLCAFAPDVVQ